MADFLSVRWKKTAENMWWSLNYCCF